MQIFAHLPQNAPFGQLLLVFRLSLAGVYDGCVK